MGLTIGSASNSTIKPILLMLSSCENHPIPRFNLRPVEKIL
ncbi:hypothetical protein BN439_3817 [Erwinia amylovora Ea644]|nr:hypothetical protein BN439_3817 [Erwinia amylovora Ea644]CCP08912.1 hypothetical protein BN440_3927 [Erwinia amylovora MR1]